MHQQCSSVWFLSSQSRRQPNHPLTANIGSKPVNKQSWLPTVTSTQLASQRQGPQVPIKHTTQGDTTDSGLGTSTFTRFQPDRLQSRGYHVKPSSFSRTVLFPSLPIECGGGSAWKHTSCCVSSQNAHIASTELELAVKHSKKMTPGLGAREGAAARGKGGRREVRRGAGKSERNGSETRKE